ncbi:MAG: tripartite tricarboxylate transporter substrate binding protein [Betaproteobacteria bacterium]|nr:tripartite tricarboxylate transporter substrate binding protein [Betaproteobacteria bacterium]
MNRLYRRALIGIAVAAGLTVAVPCAAQDSYPNRNIRVIVPFGAGTGLDTLTRVLTTKLAEELKTSIVVMNQTGSNGIIGTTTVARAPADGYTLLATTQSHYISGMMYNNMPYDPRKFVPVARFGQAQLVVVTSTTSVATNIQSFLSEARKAPEKFSFASLGTGSSAHMAGTLFNSLAGTQLLHVPYKEASQALTDTIRGEPTINFVALPTAAAQMKAGKLQALAVTGLKRSQSLPDTPTLNESGLPGYELVAWYAFFAPEGTPPDVVQKLSVSVSRITASAEFLATLARLGLDPMADNARDFAAKLPAENARWQKIVTLANAKGD